MSTPKKKTIIEPRTRNGANGISLFIVKRLRGSNNKKRLGKKAVQNANITAEIPPESPRNHPKPKASFASPSPIALPPERNHRRVNGSMMSGPAKRSSHGEV